MAIGNRQTTIGNSFPARLALAAASLIALLGTLSLACSRRSYVPRPYLAFVVSTGSNSVAVVDLASFHVVASIPVEGGPEQLAVRPASREVWVTGASGRLSVVGFPELRVIRTLHVGRA